jgi:hypothetical protein
MTIKTKQYIGIEDIIAMQFECKECNATVSLDLEKPIRTSNLGTCPNCNAGWATLSSGKSIDPTIQAFIDSFKNLKRVFAHAETLTDKQFTFWLEVKREAASMASASREGV